MIRLNNDRFTKVHGTWHKVLQCVIMFVATGLSATENAAIAYFPARPKNPESIWYWTGDGVEMGASGFATTDGVYDVYIGSAEINGRLYRYDLEGDDDDGVAIAVNYLPRQTRPNMARDTVKETEVFIPKAVWPVASGIPSITRFLLTINCG